MFIVDSQVHIWAADTPERPWVTDSPAKPHKERPFTADDLLASMKEAGVSRCVLVPPSWEGDRNDVALEAARRHPDVFAVTGRVSMEAPDRREQISGWMDQPGMLGLRLTLRTERERRLLYDPAEDWVWSLAEEKGVPLLVYPNGQLEALSKVLASHPGLRLVIDHLGLRRGKDEAAKVDIPLLVEMASRPNTAVKASCVPFYSSQPYPYRNMFDAVRSVIDAYGPERVFWGSDLTRMPCTYTQCVTMYTEEMPWLSGEALEQVMGRALCSWLDWPIGRSDAV
ncbi:amidohydrolase family protein [Pigmentiphaga soli]|uniref:Amidohydrolase family protein n=1 Tax=Pigmentiphaga soli TaxID=1007095 RepID=A0ABP8HNX8_9BURK